MSKIPVIIDHSEDPKVVAYFTSDPDFEVVQDDLPVADYIIGGLAIERKENDLLQSLAGGKLDRQIAEMKATFGRAILIIIGDLADKVKWHRGNPHNPHQSADQMMKWMLGSIARYTIEGVSVVMVKDHSEFREFMKHIAKNSKSLHPEAGQATREINHVTFKKRDRSTREIQRDILRSVTRIGSEKAHGLLDTYGSPVEVAIAASEGRISKEIRGIGRNTEVALVDAFLIRSERK